MNHPPRYGRLLVIGFDGHEIPGWLEGFADKYGLGGIILFARNCPDAKTVKSLAEEAKAKLTDHLDGWTPLVMVDQEGGRVERIKRGVSHMPAAAALSGMSLEEVETLSKIQGMELRMLGVEVNLAPVCDVLSVGESGVIGDRSFGEDPHVVGNYSAAAVRGLTAAGIGSCAKHFPGHGSSTVDTHLGAAMDGRGLTSIEKRDLAPFKRVVKAGVPMVMASHIIYSAVDPRPATRSEFWLIEILRNRLAFDGVTISDDMEMVGAREGADPVAVAADSINAGCDLLIYGGMLGERVDIFNLVEGLAREVLSEKINKRIQRLWKMRRSLSLR